MEVFTTCSPEETEKIAVRVLKNLKTNTIGLIGDLGSGKTTFVQGLAQVLGIKKRVISPSFVLIRQYRIPATSLTRLLNKYFTTVIPHLMRNLYRFLVEARNDKEKEVIKRSCLVHIDLYRLDGKIDIVSLGLKEIWENKANLVIIEWAEKIKEQWPENSLILKFESLGGNKRRIKMTKSSLV